MSKQILPHELAEIVTGLLVKPELFGELDSLEKHQAFILDIGRVVADHCGGEANWVNATVVAEEETPNQYEQPLLSVSPNGSLPSLHNNVWSYHDAEGWDDYIESDSPESLSPVSIAHTRCELQGLLSNAGLSNGKPQTLDFSMVDWRVPENTDLEEIGDDRCYSVTAYIGNQCALEFLDDKGEPRLGLMLEINHGVPALHIDVDGGDALLHIHATNGGLVLTPDNYSSRFQSAELNRFSYNDKSSVLIR